MSSSPEFRQGLNRYEDDLDADDAMTDPVADEEQNGSPKQILHRAPNEEDGMDSLGRTAEQPGTPGDELEEDQDQVIEKLDDREADEDWAP